MLWKYVLEHKTNRFIWEQNYVLDFGTIGPNVTFEYKSSAKPHLLLIEGKKYWNELTQGRTITFQEIM